METSLTNLTNAELGLMLHSSKNSQGKNASIHQKDVYRVLLELEQWRVFAGTQTFEEYATHPFYKETTRG